MKNPIRLALIFCLMLGMTLTAVEAAEGGSVTDEEAAKLTRLLKMRLGSNQIDTPVETRIEGVYQTRFGDKFGYLIDGGRYVFIGDLVDLEQAQNLTEMSRRKTIVDDLGSIPVNKLIVFPAKNEELAVLNVFTDTSCGYCQKLHQEVGFLQDAGISVRYFPYPRGGNRGPGYTDLKKVWCAEDQLAAMSIAKNASSGTLGSAECAEASFVDEGFKLGNRIGVTGTPALYTADGAKFNGYVPYQQLIPQLLNN